MTHDPKAQFILDFRRETYGVDEWGHQKPEFAKISRGYRNAIEHLSEGLYSKDVHFVLELIQNAEDNSYAADTPELSFLLLTEDPTGTPGSEGCLTVFNNELGFQEKDIEGISQVGASTKKSKIGYIGEKGIGFKSVFVVSDQPHIYSNGYRFKFKANDPDIPLSYVVPYVLEETPEIVKNNPATTAILLPLKPKKLAEITEQIGNIKPETLLFLSKLRSIKIELQWSGKWTTLICEPLDDAARVLRVRGNLVIERKLKYRVERATFQVPEELGEEKRAGIIEREVMVAFPLDSKIQGRIYAFLPTEVNSGLPFLVNADFLLSASRESIQTDKPWNQWMRDCLAKPIMEGIRKMASESAQVYQFIPLQNELTGLKEFFEPMVNEVCAGLSQQPVVRTDQDRMVLPEMALRAGKTVRVLFPPDDRPKFFERKHLLDAEAEKYKKQLAAIDVKAFSLDDLWACLEDHDWLQQRSPVWFIDLYRYLKKKGSDDAVAEAKAGIILLDDGRVIAPGDCQPVFYLKEDEDDFSTLFAQNDVLPRVAFLHADMKYLLFQEAELLRWAERVFGFGPFSLDDYIQMQLLPWLEDEIDAITVDAYLKIFAFIVSHWEKLDTETKNELKEGFPLLLENDQILFRQALRDRQLATPQALDPELGWQIVLPDAEDRAHLAVLSDRYLVGCSEENTALVGKILKAFGAVTAPDMAVKLFRRERYGCWDLREEYADALFMDYLEAVYCSDSLQESNNDGYRLQTWLPPEWLIRGEGFADKVPALLAYLQGNVSSWSTSRWDTRDTQKKWKALLQWFYRGDYKDYPDSCLLFYLKKHAWIETTKGYRRPGEVFVRNHATERLMGDRVPYLIADWDDGLIENLGIRTELTGDTVVDYLQELSRDEQVDFSLVVRLYEYLEFEHAVDASRFASHSLIYVPARNQWFTSEEVVWDDAHEVLGDSYAWLSSDYEETKGLKQFFVESLEIPEQVEAEQYARAWVGLAQKGMGREKIQQVLAKIFPVILAWIKAHDDHDDWPDWFHEFSAQVKVWTQAGQIAEPTEVFVRDSEPLAKLFRNQVDFVWKPERYTHSDLEALYQVLQVPYLSEAVSVRLDGECVPMEQDGEPVFSDASRELFCGMLRNDDPERFQDLLDDDRLKSLITAREATVETLSLVYELEEYGLETRVDSQRIFFHAGEGQIYIVQTADIEDAREELAEQIARFVWKDRGFRNKIDTIEKILETSTAEKAKKLKEKRDWSLPSDFRAKLKDWLGGTEDEDENHSETQPDEKNGATAQDTTGVSSAARSGSDQAQTDQTELNKPHGEDEGSKDRPVSERSNTGKGNQRGTDRRSPVSSGRSGFNDSGTHNSKPYSGQGEKTSSSRSGSGHGAPASGGSVPRSRSNHLSTQIQKRNQSRLISYVQPPDHQDDASQRHHQQRKKQLGDLAEQWVAELEASAGFEVRRMPENHPGYDLERIDRKTGEVAYIEVKATEAEWGGTGVGITPVQYRFLQAKEKQAWLYVVENAHDPAARRLYRLQDPVNHIQRYFFDHGWRSVAEDAEVASGSAVPSHSLVDELKALTDENGGGIIDYCEQNQLPLPEIGYELITEAGEVAEELELAWPDHFLGLYTDEPVESISEWTIMSLDEIANAPDRLHTLLVAEAS